MNDKTNDVKPETQVPNDQVVVVERAPRLIGGLSVRSRIHAGKKAAVGGEGTQG
jgi:hypothetical protein